MRSPLFLFGIFAFIGLPFLIFGSVPVASSVSKLMWPTAEGKITAVYTDNNITAEFDYEGQHYVVNSSFGEDSMEEGQAITLRFPPNNPQEAEIKTFLATWLISIIGLFFGFCFGMVGFFGIRREVRKRKAKNELFTEGRGKKLAKQPALVRLNTRYSVNRVNPYVIDVEWTDPYTKINYTFRSENIWYDPNPYIKDNAVDVYIDEQNPKRYYVDITFLPKNS